MITSSFSDVKKREKIWYRAIGDWYRDREIFCYRYRGFAIAIEDRDRRSKICYREMVSGSGKPGIGSTLTDIQTGRSAGRPTGRQTDRQINKPTDRQTDRYRDEQTDERTDGRTNDR